MRRRRGFTLIELLVVIAIIAILAAMLFPVFARARESARKIQCLSNVKNIATAVQMYLSDYDRLPPNEHRQDIINFMNDAGGGECWAAPGTMWNPYLRWPVILDEYVKNREVWGCPSSRMGGSFGIISGRGGDWFAVASSQDSLCVGAAGPCYPAFPTGWGGAVTDSYLQGECVNLIDPNSQGSVGVFSQNLGTPQDAKEVKTSAMGDPAKYIVVGDAGSRLEVWASWQFAYPDVCKLECVSCEGGVGVDWTNCPSTTVCGAGDPKLGVDATYRKKQFPGRHLSGSNLGFADGHATWMNSETILFGAPDRRDFIPANQKKEPIIEGVNLCKFPPIELQIPY